MIDKEFSDSNKKFWILFASPFLLLFTVFFLAAKGFMGYMPNLEELENPKIDLATHIISEDGETLGTVYYKNQNRTQTSYNELPKHLIDALIATEDVRFWKHSGIDFKGTARAVIRGGSEGGGSTITQQYAKMLFHERATSFTPRLKQKIKEYVIATKIERAYTKEEILTMYFNQYDFLYSAVGIHTASYVYFNKTPDMLQIEEAAVLVGMAKSPVKYNPRINPEHSLRRRNTVLNQMKKYGFIEPDVCDSLKSIPLTLDFKRVDHNMGVGTYFREFIKYTLSAEEPVRKKYRNYKTYVEDSLKWADDPVYGWCNKNTNPDGSPYDIYSDGLRIYTTVNSKMQVYAEEAVKAHLGGFLQPAFNKEKRGKPGAPFSRDLTTKQRDQIIWSAIRNSERGRKLYNKGLSADDINKVFKVPIRMSVYSWRGEIDTIMSPLDSILYYKQFLHTGFISMDPYDGHVKAYVGGINYENFKYDHVTRGKRQAGSTFKPFLYILAMQEGYSPCMEVLVAPTTFRDNDKLWTPRTTAKPEHLNTYKTLKWGLATSENYISAFLVNKFNPQPIADIAYKMGIESYIDPVPSMIYGSSDMRVEEMIGAFGTMANKGIHVKPLYVTRIEDKYGNVLATFEAVKREAISEKTAYLMINLLEGGTEYGTGVRLRYEPYNFTSKIAGKTGTTNNNSDGWFIGMTPQLISGAWVGADDRSVHFNSTAMGGGHSMALPIWGQYMMRIYADSTLGITQEDVFEAPEGFDMLLDCNSIDGSAGESGDPFGYNSEGF